MSYDIEKAPSNQSRCAWCKKRILKGTKRLIYTSSYFGHPTYKYYCPKCGKKVMAEEIRELKKVKFR